MGGVLGDPVQGAVPCPRDEHPRCEEKPSSRLGSRAGAARAVFGGWETGPVPQRHGAWRRAVGPSCRRVAPSLLPGAAPIQTPGQGAAASQHTRHRKARAPVPADPEAGSPGRWGLGRSEAAP